jgi:hypothetical protein
MLIMWPTLLVRRSFSEGGQPEAYEGSIRSITEFAPSSVMT